MPVPGQTLIRELGTELQHFKELTWNQSHMTPAINAVKKARIDFHIHEYTHDPQSQSYGEEAAEKLGIKKERVFKTLVVSKDNGEFCVAVLPVSHQLNLKQFARAAGTKKAVMADKKSVEKITGYVLGGVSPIGQKKKLPTLIHESAKKYATVFVSAGRRGVDIEISPVDLLKLTQGKFDIIC